MKGNMEISNRGNGISSDMHKGQVTAKKMIEETAGMLHDKIPKDLHGKDIDQVIAEGTTKYFRQRAKRGL